jgi:GT2 family glycosyltransferase
VTVAFDSHDDLVADVVVIAWERVDTLRACLESLSAMVGAPPFGVRIAANGASAEVREFLRDEVVGATIVDIAENIGFGGGCNAAAAGSIARNLVFLNDDAVVHQDWLSALVRCADAMDATAVGALLLNADGTVQEAGSRVRRDAGTVQFGAGLGLDEAARLALLTPRRADYCSGASLLVRREAFETLGGFDEVFRPAYFEDVDLCFRIAAGGGAVYFAPDARVTHIGGGSTSASIRFRAFASDHAGALFARRWAQTLADAPSADEPVDRLCPVAPPDLQAVPRGEPVHDARSAALRVQREFAAWLESHLDEAEVEARHLRDELAAVRSADDPG